MLNSKDGFFGKRDDKVRKEVGNVYGMTSSSSASTSTSSTPAMITTPSTSSSASSSAASDAAKGRTDSAARADEGKGNKLIVGPDIKLKGEINDCDTIIVEGRIEATTDSRVLQISESGSFTGTVGIDVAEIRGRFQGELTARQKLVIYATGSVSGKIRYGKIVIEEGGELNGDVSSLAAAKSDSKGDYWQEQDKAKAAGGKTASA